MKKSGLVLLIAFLSNFSHADEGSDGTWTLQARKLYSSPADEPLMSMTIDVVGGTVSAVRDAKTHSASSVRAHPECQDGVVTSGFYNSHVHFTGPDFYAAKDAAPAKLNAALDAMLNRYGFTTVIDTGSDAANTFALRARIEAGELRGPRIFTAGSPIYPHRGLPVYLEDLPRDLLEQLAQPADAEAAVRHVESNIRSGADLTKLFVATPQKDKSIKDMQIDIARAAAKKTRDMGGRVVAHPTNERGIRTALAADVDVLAHTTLDEREPWPDELVQQLIKRQVGLVPTLQLWEFELGRAKVPTPTIEALVARTLEQLRAFSKAGGEVLFGTDVGYMTVFDPTEEYALMSRAGMTPMMILSSLTTAPAKRWDANAKRGAIAPGFQADLVVLEADPEGDVRNFAKVRCTFRRGRLVYSAARGAAT